MKKLSFAFLFCAVALLIPHAIFAQLKTTGNVCDKQHNAIIGATVYQEGFTQNGTVTNMFGNYSLLTVPQDSITIVCTYVGYETQKKGRKGQILNFVMKEQYDSFSISGFYSLPLYYPFE